MIFGSLDADAEPLEEFLGDMKWYFDIMLGRSDGGLEVHVVPHRWVVRTNWKISSDNFGGDPYHTAMTHRSTVELGISPRDPLFASYGHQIVLGNGHGVNMITSKDGTVSNPYQGLPEQMWSMFERNLSPVQLQIFHNTRVIVGTRFPNLSFVSPMHGTGGPDHPLTSFVNFRVGRPVGPDTLEIWSWVLVDKEAPEAFKEASYLTCIGSFGPAGTLEQDDTEIWTRVVDASKGIMAQDKDVHYNNVLNYLMGLDRVEPDPSWPRPGVAYPTCYLEAISRAFYERWVDLLLSENDWSGVTGMSTVYEEVTHFLYREAGLLDHRKLDEWLALLDDSIVYRMPLRVTRDRNGGPSIIDEMTFLDETKASLVTRVERLKTTSAWAEEPVSRTRHFISNILVEPGDAEDEVRVGSYFLLLRSRREKPEREQLFGERQDVLKKIDGQWKLMSRTIYPDQTVLNIPNISVFL